AAALAAATGALARVDSFNRVRAGAGEPVMTLDVALHLGEVLYGNVGSNERLDFTMIGPAVNEASRIEALCAELGCPLLMSGSFVAALGGADRFRSVGRHRLRGVRAERELFTVPEPLAAAAVSG